MKATDGLVRGSPARNTGSPITVPVGPETLGHIFYVLGETLDIPVGSIEFGERWPIHRPSPDFADRPLAGSAGRMFTKVSLQ